MAVRMAISNESIIDNSNNKLNETNSPIPIISNESDDSEEDIPYHARENAQPFTYGNLPKNFKLREVHQKDDDVKSNLSNLSPNTARIVKKIPRRYIWSKFPVLRKTPTREEFEEMLRERKEQALTSDYQATKDAQYAAIKDDLNELQERINRNVLQKNCKNIIVNNNNNNNNNNSNNNDNNKSNCEIITSNGNMGYNDNDFNCKFIEENKNMKRSVTPTFPIQPPSPMLKSRCVHINTLVDERSLKLLNDSKVENLHKNEPTENLSEHIVKFTRDSSQFWYKPYMTRDEAIRLLEYALPGTFIIRKSTTYKNAYGLVVRVCPHLSSSECSKHSESADILVRHYLIEPTTRGVRLKGGTNEPIFTSLSALVYQHSISRMSLPCPLIIPKYDLLNNTDIDIDLRNSQRLLLEEGAACNVLYLYSMNTESLTGDEAIRKTINKLCSLKESPKPLEVHFKVSQNGITLTDNKRLLYFRKHYATKNISCIELDPNNRYFNIKIIDEQKSEQIVHKELFAFVAKTVGAIRDNQCYVFCDLIHNQPASAIVSFAHRVLRFDITKHNNIL